MTIGWELAAIMMALLLFGIGYDRFVTWLEKEAQAEGFVALLVVGGTVVTLAGAMWIIGLEATVMVALCFMASGTPMVIGSVRRYMRERGKARREVERLVNGGGDGDGQEGGGIR